MHTRRDKIFAACMVRRELAESCLQPVFDRFHDSGKQRGTIPAFPEDILAESSMSARWAGYSLPDSITMPPIGATCSVTAQKLGQCRWLGKQMHCPAERARYSVDIGCHQCKKRLATVGDAHASQLFHQRWQVKMTVPSPRCTKDPDSHASPEAR